LKKSKKKGGGELERQRTQAEKKKRRKGIGWSFWMLGLFNIEIITIRFH